MPSRKADRIAEVVVHRNDQDQLGDGGMVRFFHSEPPEDEKTQPSSAEVRITFRDNKPMKKYKVGKRYRLVLEEIE